MKGYHIRVLPSKHLLTLKGDCSSRGRDPDALGEASHSVSSYLRVEFYSNMFMVPKKGGDQRPVINLKHLNRFVKSPIYSQNSSSEERLDGQDRSQRCFLHGTNSSSISPPSPFQGGNEDLSVQLSSIWSVHCSQGALKPVVKLLRSIGIHLVTYIDDMLNGILQDATHRTCLLNPVSPQVL